MATLAPHQPADLAPMHWTEGNPSDDQLAHIPGEAGWPIIGNTFRMLADPHGMAKSMVEKYGRVCASATSSRVMICSDVKVTSVPMTA